MMATCNRADCPNEATRGVYLQLRVHPDHVPAVSNYLVLVCDEHKEVQWDDIVDKRSWQAICQNFQAMGLDLPKRKYSNIVVEKLPVSQ